MKTTIHIHDELLARAKRHAKKTHRSLRALVEDGLRWVLSEPAPQERFRLADLSFGDPCGDNPLDAYSWQDLSEIIYEHPGRE